MARLKSELVLSLNDQVSGPARRMDQHLENLRQQHMRTTRTYEQHRNAMLGTAVAAYAFGRALSAPVQASMQFSTQLEDIRQKADMSSEAIERMGRAARDIGLDTAQGAGTIAGAIDSMIGSGAVTPEQAQAIATPLGKASTAYTADPTEMANATSAMVLQLGLAADEMEKAYDIMAVGGKMGSFELKDMASQFPGVLAQAESLGIEGEKGLASVVAWLQIARRGTADASTAATNMSNFMGKILAPDAIRNFGEAGVDIVNEMKRATEAGVDPIEHAVGIINGLTEGQRDKLGELFADTQVTNFLLQATKGIEDYRAIRDEALAADGTVARDFEARLETPQAKINRLMASMENLNIAIGDSLTPALIRFADSVTPMIDGVASFVDANGELVAAVVEITAALIGLRLLAAAGGMAPWLLGLGAAVPAVAAPSAAVAGLPVAGVLAAIASQVFIGGKGVYGGDTPNDPSLSPSDNLRAAIENDIESGKLNPNSFFGLDLGQGIRDLIHNPQGGIGGGYTGATQGQIDAIKGEIEKLDAEIAEWPEQALEERRAQLVEKLAGMEAELAASSNAVTTDFGAMMDRLRAMAAAGVSIPLSVNGAIPSIGAMPPPSGPRLAPPVGTGGNTTTMGDVHVNVTTPTNANPHQIARAVGREVADTLRAAHTNGGMA